MGTGYLEVVTDAAIGSLPVANAHVTIYSGENILHELFTDESGIAAAVPLPAPAKELTLDPEYTGIPYSTYDVRIEAPHMATIVVHNVEILDTITSLLPVNMHPALSEDETDVFDIPPNQLVSDETRHMERPGPLAQGRVLSEVIIPEFITVHLGRPDNPNARNVRVPFPYYIKNVCSHEIFAPWPQASLEANIYCQISLALNRIFTNAHRLGTEKKG